MPSLPSLTPKAPEPSLRETILATIPGSSGTSDSSSTSTEKSTGERRSEAKGGDSQEQSDALVRTADMDKLHLLIAQQAEFETMYKEWLFKYEGWRGNALHPSALGVTARNALHPSALGVTAQWDGWKAKLLAKRESVQKMIEETLGRITVDRLTKEEEKSGKKSSSEKEESGKKSSSGKEESGKKSSSGKERDASENGSRDVAKWEKAGKEVKIDRAFDDIVEVEKPTKKVVVQEVITLDEESDMNCSFDDLLSIPKKPPVKEDQKARTNEEDVRVKQEPRSDRLDPFRRQETKRDPGLRDDGRRPDFRDSRSNRDSRSGPHDGRFKRDSRDGWLKRDSRDGRFKCDSRDGRGRGGHSNVVILQRRLRMNEARELVTAASQCKNFLTYLNAFDLLYPCRKKSTG